MTALIQIDDGGGAVTGSIEAPAATVCTFSNVDNTGVLGWFWELVDKPAGSAAVLSSAVVAAPTITVDIPGTYLVRLSTYFDAARTLFDGTDLQGVGVRYTGAYTWRLPAAHETTQFDATDGWKAEVNAILDTVRTGLTAAVGATLQAAYDGGQTIDQTATALSMEVHAGTSVNTALVVTRDSNGSAPVMTIARTPTTAQTGEGLSISMGANAMSSGIVADHSGSGVAVQGLAHGSGAIASFTADNQLSYGVYVTMSDAANANDALVIQHDGFGRGLVVTASGEAAYLETDNEAGVILHLYDTIAVEDVLTVGGAGMVLGTATGPVSLQAYSWAAFNGAVTNGSAASATLKEFSGWTTDIATTTTPTNNFGRLLWRPGTNTAASTVADLAHQAGSAAEVLITKGGRVYTPSPLIELPIQSGETISAGQAVGSATANGRVARADASSSGPGNCVGICISGGTGDAGGTVYALFAMSGYISGLSGLTRGLAVYVSGTTPGSLTHTPPTTSGSYTTYLGVAISATEMILQPGQAVGTA